MRLNASGFHNRIPIPISYNTTRLEYYHNINDRLDFHFAKCPADSIYCC